MEAKHYVITTNDLGGIVKMKTNKLVVLLFGIGVILSGALGLTTIGYADSTPLSVKAILPDNQHNKEVSYYHLMMKAGQKQEIDLQLFNSSDKETTAEITLTAATTNNNGTIDYNLPSKEIDKSLLYPFPSIATTPKEVKIPANSDITTKIAIEMPMEEYSGMILGGINVKVKKEKVEEKKEKSSGGMKIENEMNYSIGVVLVENEETVKTDMTLERVFASQVMGNNTTKATLRNPTAAVMENVTIEAKIYAKGSDAVLYETKQEGYRMAPNSSFDFGVPIGNERYKAGEYRIKLTATSDPKKPEDGEKQVWEFDESFTIKREEADKLNAEAIDLPTDYLPYIIMGGIALLVVIALIVFIVIVKRKKKQAKELEQKRKARKNRTKSTNKK